MPPRPPQLQKKRLGCEQLEQRITLDSTVVFNEIMYNAWGPDDSQEWIELHNQLALDVDLTGWHIEGGVHYEFPAGTAIPADGYLVVAADPVIFDELNGVLGPYTGALSNAGEDLRLLNNSDRQMDRVEYRDEDNWPVGPDGSGATLVKTDEQWNSDDVGNWTTSRELGGTPGAENFPQPDRTPTTTQPIELLSQWHYDDSGTDLGTGWRDPGFNDNHWQIGQAVFHAGSETVTQTGQGLRFLPVHGDEDSGISREHEYTHALDFGSGNVALINGVPFQPVTTLNLDAIADFQYNVSSGVKTNATGSGTTNVTGDLDDLLFDYISNAVNANGGTATIVIGGLEVGRHYDARLYTRQLDSNARNVTISVETSGDDNPEETFAINQNDASQSPPGFADTDQSYAISYDFIAESTQIEFTITQAAFNTPFLLYGLTNQVIGGTSSTQAIDTLFSTGVSNLGIPLSPGAPDPHWTNAATGDPLIAMSPNGAWNSPTATSQWTGVVASGSAGVAPGAYVFETTFDLSQYDPTTARLAMQIAVDDSLASVSLNGVSAGISSSGFDAFNGPFTIDSGFLPGLNTLSFTVNNGGSSANPSGLHVNFDGTAVAMRENTILNEGPTTHYFRQTFDFHGDVTAHHELQLDATVDDGAVFYLNGQEVHRHNMPNGDVAYGTLASDNVGNASATGRMTIPAERLVVGENVFAVEVHQSGKNSDVRFASEVVVVETPAPAIQPPQLVFSEIAAGNVNAFFVEVHNRDQAPLDLSTFTLRVVGSQDTDVSLPATIVAPNQYAIIVPDDIRLTPLAGDRLFLLRDSEFIDGREVTARLRGTTTRSDDAWNNEWLYPTDPSPGSANPFDFEDDIVINEILYHAPPQFATADQPFVPNSEEWIELTNRGKQTVDLTGWQIVGGIDFAFPSGTALAPGEYLVVASDATSLQARHSNIDIVGNFDRSLSDNNDLIRLVDARRNPADEVHYYEGGRWPALADGGGSSLELGDVYGDNAVGESWSASDETDQSGWQTIRYRGLANEAPGSNNPTVWNEFILGLLDAGEVLIDDVSVIEDPDGAAIERIQNGSFDSGTDTWRLVGTHGQHGLSSIVPDPDEPQNNVLHLVVTAATEHMSNHVETTFAGGATIVNGREYEISLRARWLSGSPQLHTRLYFNRLAETTILETPNTYGTPGQANSTALVNAGPTFDSLAHFPVVPRPEASTHVSVAASDSDGVSSVDLLYSVDGQPLQSVPMTNPTGDIYEAVVPGQRAAAVVQFYVEAVDQLGNVSRFPAAGPQSRALYQVDNNAATNGPQHNFRIIMTAEDYDAMLEPTNVMTNHRLGATVIFDETQIYYDVGVRLKGSGFSRGSAATGFNLRFNPEQLLFGVHDIVAIDRQGGPWGIGASHRELTLKHIANQAGDIPMMYDDAIYVIAPNPGLNGTAQLLAARYDDEFLDAQYENGSNGTRFKFDLIYYSTRTDSGDPEDLKLPPGYSVAGVFPVLGVDIQSLGDDPDAYRWNYLIRNNRPQDDFSRIIDMAQAFSLTGSTVGGALDLAAKDVIDVDQWMRLFAFESLAGINDTYNQGLPHNLQFYVRPADSRVLAFPWDMDFSFHHATNVSIYGTGSNLRKIIDIPTNRRLFQGHLYDIMSTTFNVDYLDPWIDHIATRSVEDNSTEIRSYVEARRSFVLSRLLSQVEFQITTNNGNDFSVDTPTVELTGRGWIDVRDVRLFGSGDSLDIRWTSDRDWRVTMPLQSGPNTLQLQAYNHRGELVGTDTITVSSSIPNRIAEDLRVSEINYNPASPTAAEVAAIPGLDNDDFEFVEFFNAGDTTLNLLGTRFTDGIDFTFPDVALQPGKYGAIVRNTEAFAVRYGDDVNILGEFQSGGLNNAGEKLAVQMPDGSVLFEIDYDDGDLWHERADGLGATLELIDPDATTVEHNGKYYAWRGSTNVGGTPGGESTQPIGVVINEVIASASESQADSIELRNTSDERIHVQGWYLSSSESTLVNHLVPNRFLEPGDYLVVNAQPLSLNKDQGDDIWLVVGDENGQVAQFVDEVHFGAAGSNRSLNRAPIGGEQPITSSRNTLGCQNSPAQPAPVVISEIRYAPPTPTPDQLALAPDLVASDMEFVEIYNTTLHAIDLSHWRIRGGIQYDFEMGTTLPPAETLVLISFDPHSVENADRLAAAFAFAGDPSIRVIGGYSGQLNNNGEAIRLQAPAAPPMDDPDFVPRILVDEVIYDDLAPWPSGALLANGESIVRVSTISHGSTATAWDAGMSPGEVIVLPTSLDLTVDGLVDVNDVDLLTSLLNSNHELVAADLNHDGKVDPADLEMLLASLGSLPGDSDLDGRVISPDLNEVGTHWQQSGCLTWSDGDFTGDGNVDVADLNIVGIHWQQTIPDPAPASRVPRAPLAANTNATRARIIDTILAELTMRRRGTGADRTQRLFPGKRPTMPSPPTTPPPPPTTQPFPPTTQQERTLFFRSYGSQRT